MNAGHTTGTACYYACGLRKKLGKKLCACTLYHKAELERFIVDALKHDLFTPERIKKGLDYLAAERTRNEAQDDTATKALKADIRQTDVELGRFYDAIKQGMKAVALEQPINELSDKKLSLTKRLADLEEQHRKDRKLPEATDKMVTQVLTTINKMLDTTDPDELKAALARFIDRIELRGEDIEMTYTFDIGNNLAVQWRPRGDLNP